MHGNAGAFDVADECSLLFRFQCLYMRDGKAREFCIGCWNGVQERRGVHAYSKHTSGLCWVETTVVACKHRNKKEQTCVTKRVT